jgi:hypothetical protein
VQNSRYGWIVRNALMVACLVVGLAALSGRAAAAPAAQAGGTISGQVLSADNVPLPNVKLAAYTEQQGATGRVAVATFQSDAQGRYTAQVPAGRITVAFLTQDVLGQSFWGYDNLPVDVAAGATVTGEDFRVAIRVVAAGAPTPAPPPAATAEPTAAPVATPMPVGMPSTGAGEGGFDAAWIGLLGGLCLLAGLAGRRMARARG